MSKLKFDAVGQRFYETGVEHGVLYLQVDGAYPKGVAWNGLTSVSENPSGAEANPLYADNIKYLNLQSAEDFGATIECYTYPDEFAECDGSAEPTPGVLVTAQPRKPFGFSYSTRIGNDQSPEAGEKIHLIYGAVAAPSQKANNTVNDNPEAITLSYEISTTPVPVTGFKPTAHLIIDSRTTPKDKMQKLKDILYGTDPTTGPTSQGAEARMPLPDEVISLVKTI